MTDPAPQTSTPVSARRVLRWRRLAALLVGVAVSGLVGYWLYLRFAERPRALAAITAAGGKYYEPPALQRIARSVLQMFGGNNQGSVDVLLDGPMFDDAWLAAQHDLRSLDIEDLALRNTRLTLTAIRRLLTSNQLQHFIAPGMALTDDDAALIGAQSHLTHVDLMQTQISDVGLAAVRPQRLLFLNVAGTRVTSAALQKALVGNNRILVLRVDGRQFTPELASTLTQSKSLRGITLIGPDVTDAHLKLLESMQNVAYFRIEQTNVSEEAIAALRTTRSQPSEVEIAPPAEVFFKWWTDQPAAAP
ncbi:MAG: hypothetical protein U0992_09225 [Planctomycetaceae bacterium]